MKLTDKQNRLAYALYYSVDTDEHGHIKALYKEFLGVERRVCRIMIDDRSLTMGWQTADLVDGKFTNHLKFEELEKALHRPVLTDDCKGDTPQQAKKKYGATHMQLCKDGVTPIMYYRKHHTLYNDDTISKRWQYLDFNNSWSYSSMSLESGNKKLKEI